MADEQDRHLCFVAQPFQIGQDFGLARLVQGRHRLIHQQHRRVGQQGAANGDAAALAARKRAGPAGQQRLDPQKVQHALQRLPRPLLCKPAPVQQVLAHRQMREQARILKHIAQTAAMHRDIDPARTVEQHPPVAGDAPRIRPQQARHGIDDGRLARPRPPEQRGDPGRRREGNVQREACKSMAQMHIQRHAPAIRRATDRPTHSDRSSASIAMAMATSTSRNAASSPPGTCR